MKLVEWKDVQELKYTPEIMAMILRGVCCRDHQELTTQKQESLQYLEVEIN